MEQSEAPSCTARKISEHSKKKELRDCQVEAINRPRKILRRRIARALSCKWPPAAGKTWMAVTECYRPGQAPPVHSDILFLVDRGNLGRQAKHEFDSWRSPYTQRLFTDEYIVQRLESTTLEPRAKVVISTIQRLYSALTGKPIDARRLTNAPPMKRVVTTDQPRPVTYNRRFRPRLSTFIIVDEVPSVHLQPLERRARLLRRVPNRPHRHAGPCTRSAIFNQNLVSSYTHEQAVLDKINVGYDIYRIRTKLTEKGATVERGNHLEKIERRTRRKRWEKLKGRFHLAARGTRPLRRFRRIKSSPS